MITQAPAPVTMPSTDPAGPPLESDPQNTCFGCGPDNPVGLQLTFERDGDTVVSTFVPTDTMEGWPGRLHSGILYTAMVEVANWTVHGLLDRLGFPADTSALDLRRWVGTGEQLELVGELVDPEHGGEAAVRVTARDDSGEIVAQLVREFELPSREAFLTKTGYDEVPTVLEADLEQAPDSEKLDGGHREVDGGPRKAGGGRDPDPDRLAPGVGMVVLDEEDRVLLHRRRNEDAWAPPSGHVERGETVREAALREIEEETGLEVELEVLVDVVSDPAYQVVRTGRSERTQFVTTLFRARATGGRLDGSDEGLAWGWFDPADLPEPLTDYAVPWLDKALE